MRSSLALMKADNRGFSRRARRAHREARNAHDALFQAQRVQNLGGLFGQTNDAPRITPVHVGLKRTFGKSAGRAVHDAVRQSR